MSIINHAGQELAQWIQQQLAQGVSQKKLYFFLLQKGFSQDVVSLMLSNYKPPLNTAVIEQLPPKEAVPQPEWFDSQAHFFSYANINITHTQKKRKVPVDDVQMYVLPDVIPAKLCDQIIIRSKRYFSPSQVIGNKYSQANSGRTSSTALVRDIAPDAERKIQLALGELMGIDCQYCEPLQIQRYQPGQEYQTHADWFDKDHDGYQENIRHQGQRTWTCLIYLNHDFTGGETHFPDIKLKVKPEQGKASIWNNLTLTGDVNKKTFHSGLTVTRGDKYILTAWFRARPSLSD